MCSLGTHMNDKEQNNGQYPQLLLAAKLEAFFICPFIKSNLNKNQGHSIKNHAIKAFLQKFLPNFKPVR